MQRSCDFSLLHVFNFISFDISSLWRVGWENIFTHPRSLLRHQIFVIHHFCTLFSYTQMSTKHCVCLYVIQSIWNVETESCIIFNEFMKFIMWQNLRKFHSTQVTIANSKFLCKIVLFPSFKFLILNKKKTKTFEKTKIISTDNLSTILPVWLFLSGDFRLGHAHSVLSVLILYLTSLFHKFLH